MKDSMLQMLEEKVSEQEVIRRMNCLRGLFAILIVLGHCSMHFEEEPFVLLVIHKFNMVGVCFFFVISGWSICYNFYSKKQYLKGFVKNKVLKLFIFALICEMITNVLTSVVSGLPILLGASVLADFNWYIYESIAYYMCFFCCLQVC